MTLFRYLDRLLCRLVTRREKVRIFTHVGTGISFPVRGDLAAAHVALRGMGWQQEARA